MRRFLWNFCGDDKQIIARCNNSLKNRFAGIGVLVCLIFLVCYLSSWICLDMLFESIWLDLPLSFFFAWMITNIYLVVLSTFSRHVLPVKYSDVIKNLSIILRLSFIFLFAIYTAKLIESGILDVLLSRNLITISHGNLSINTFDVRLRLLSYVFPLSLSWIFTGLNTYLFMLPLWLKRKVIADSEFYNIKRLVEKGLIERSYQTFKEEYVAFLLVHDPEVSYYENYLDAPFNTIKKSDTRTFTDQADLFDLYNS